MGEEPFDIVINATAAGLTGSVPNVDGAVTRSHTVCYDMSYSKSATPFVTSNILSGGDQELYDYLAEEVVGDLPQDLQAFLMRTSILQVVTPDLAGVATRLGAVEVSRLTAAAERVTLLGRRARGPRTELRYHPLVREFLEARLQRDFGE